MTAPDPSSATPSAAPPPSWGLALLAGALPPMGAIAALVALQVMTARGLARVIEESGTFGLLVLAGALFSSFFCAILVLVSARGRGVPALLAAFFASVPWWLGLLTLRIGIGQTIAAVHNADFASRAPLLARGFSEAAQGRVLGGALGGALAIGVAAALLVGMRARRDLPPGGALAGVVAMLTLGWFGVTAAAASYGLAELFGAASHAEPSQRASLMAEGLGRADLGALLYWGGGVVLTLAALGLAAAAIVRGKPSAGRIAVGVLLALVIAGSVGLDQLGARGAMAAIEDEARLPWTDVADFQPIALPARTQGDVGDAPFVLGLAGLGGPSPISIADLATDAGRARASAQFHERVVIFEEYQDEYEEVPEWLLETEDDGAADGETPPDPGVADGATIAIAVDGRVGLEVLRTIARAAQEAGANHLAIVGAATPSHPITGHGALLERMTTPVVAVTFALENALTAGAPDRDDVLLHATLGASPASTLAPRSGSTIAPIPFGGEGPVETPADLRFGLLSRRAVYLALGSDATVSSLALAGASIAGSESIELIPVLCLGEIPGHPEQAHAPHGEIAD